jgi:hypothetical protein
VEADQNGRSYAGRATNVAASYVCACWALAVSYAHGFSREDPSYAAFKTIVSGFTPVNRPNELTTLAGEAGTNDGGGTQNGGQKRKRTKASAQASGNQKEANTSHSRKARKFEPPSETRLQTILKNLRRTKAAENMRTLLADELKDLPHEIAEHTELQSDIDPKTILSRHTMQKLESFRYQSASSSIGNRNQDTYPSESLDQGATGESTYLGRAGNDESIPGLPSAQVHTTSSTSWSEYKDDTRYCSPVYHSFPGQDAHYSVFELSSQPLQLKVTGGPGLLDKPTVHRQDGKQVENPRILQPAPPCGLDDFDEALESEYILPPSNQEQTTFITGGRLQIVNKNAMSADCCGPALSPDPWTEPTGLRRLEESGQEADVEDDEFPMDDEGLEDLAQLTEDVREQTYLPNRAIFRNSVDLVSEAERPNGTEDQPVQLSSPLDKADEAILSFFDDDSDFLNSPTIHPQSSHNLNLPATKNALNAEANISEDPENIYDDDDLDTDLMNLASSSPGNADSSTPPSSPGPTTPKLQWMPPTTYIPVKLRKIPGPSTPPAAPVSASTALSPHITPFVRTPFPQPIGDRSPIIGLHPRTVLRTCFRIGEALNAASAASRTNTDAVIELYVRVIYSGREPGSIKQTFQFADLFTSDKPPFLSGTFTLWKGVGLWDHDSKAFLGEEGKGKMARVVGRMRRRELGRGCEMCVLSVWECDWEDVGVARGVVCS